MIKFIRGTYALNLNGGIVVENQSGIGFEISVPAGSPIYKYSIGDAVMIYTSMIVKEDDISLYGFHNLDSLELFEKLITVSGIGAKGAMSILSSLSAEELKRAIMMGDAKEISKANGVGKKTAERLILELKDKLGPAEEAFAAAESAGMSGISAEPGDGRTEAISAMVALGYTKAEAFSAVAAVNDEGLTGEEYIRKALKNLL